MIMKPGPIVRAIEAIEGERELLKILLTPQGDRLDQKKVNHLSERQEFILVCGRYEGVDERVRQGWIDCELSIGDYVLSGGEPAALCLVDAVVRQVPGVLGNTDSLDEESFAGDRLEYPQYTRPRTFRGMDVPEVLLSGDHGRIEQWRRAESLRRTRQRRSDLLTNDPEER